MKEIYPSLYQFSMTIPYMNFTIHQYLLNGESPVLFATGTWQQAKAVLPKIKEILRDKKLKYIVVSHIESDECGGLGVFLAEYPEANVLCSHLGARELPGYGINANFIPCDSETQIADENAEFHFIDYPSEVHLQDGILVYEKKSGILYSADLFLRFGEGAGQVINADWMDEVASITSKSVANEEKLMSLKKSLLAISPAFTAVGHGYCVTK